MIDMMKEVIGEDAMINRKALLYNLMVGVQLVT
jgi:hypothetical protein